MTRSNLSRKEGHKHMTTCHYVRKRMVRLPGATDKVLHHPVNIILVVTYMQMLVAAPVVKL